VVDNGKAIRETQEQIRQMPAREEMTAAVEGRLGKVEESVGSLDKGLMEQLNGLKGNVATIDQGLREFGAQLGAPSSRLVMELSRLSRQLDEHKEFFTKPTRKEVHYSHYLGRPLWVLFVVVLIAALEAGALAYSWHQEVEYEQHDLLWRAARLSEDSVVTTALDTLQRSWQRDAEQFRKDVDAEEQRRTELIERVMQERQTMGRIQELQEQKRKMGGRGGGH
jgi:hypothetical protein